MQKLKDALREEQKRLEEIIAKAKKREWAYAGRQSQNIKAQKQMPLLSLCTW